MKRVPFPVMGTEIPIEKYRPFDLSVEGIGQKIKDPYFSMGEWVEECSENGQYVCYGGFREIRGIYTADQYVKNLSGVRNLHLGVDVWLPAGTPVFAPMDGVVHSFAYNEKPLDYGWTIILKHQIANRSVYLLFGHLSKESLVGLRKGQKIKRGEEFCHLGDRHENGGWYPHLHLQLIKKMGRFKGDYPGVVAPGSQNIIENCPDPTFLVLGENQLPEGLISR